MQIDSSELQKAKADRRFESDSKSPVLSARFEQQHHGRSSSIEDGIWIDSGEPITQTSDRTSKSTKNPFTARNETDPSLISIDPIPLVENASSSIAVTEAGIESQVNDGQFENANWSIAASLDGRSNVTD
jgi:hypothetical protein